MDALVLFLLPAKTVKTYTKLRPEQWAEMLCATRSLDQV